MQKNVYKLLRKEGHREYQISKRNVLKKMFCCSLLAILVMALFFGNTRKVVHASEDVVENTVVEEPPQEAPAPAPEPAPEPEPIPEPEPAPAPEPAPEPEPAPAPEPEPAPAPEPAQVSEPVSEQPSQETVTAPETGGNTGQENEVIHASDAEDNQGTQGTEEGKSEENVTPSDTTPSETTDNTNTESEGQTPEASGDNSQQSSEGENKENTESGTTSDNDTQEEGKTNPDGNDDNKENQGDNTESESTSNPEDGEKPAEGIEDGKETPPSSTEPGTDEGGSGDELPHDNQDEPVIYTAEDNPDNTAEEEPPAENTPEKEPEAKAEDEEKPVVVTDSKEATDITDNKEEDENKEPEILIDPADAEKEEKEEEKKDETKQENPNVTGTNIQQVSSVSASYGQPGSYSASYNSWQNVYQTWYDGLSEYQKLLVGMQQTSKRYAIAKEDLTVLSAKDETAAEIGKLEAGALCFILSEEDGFYFIESGEVRGFIKAGTLITGVEAERIVKEKGEASLGIATALVPPYQNSAFRYVLVTTETVPQQPVNTMAYSTGTLGGLFGAQNGTSRTAVIAYAKQFLGRPYVWGGTDLWNGTDCSGFTQGIYAHFGISIPRVSYEQCYAGTRIDAQEALPGDLIFYAKDGVVYHVLMYIGEGKAINAAGTDSGIIISNVDYSKVCWACRFLSDTEMTVPGTITRVSDLAATGRLAYQGDAAAQKIIVDALAAASAGEWETYGYARSVLIAQAIQDSGWLSFENGAGHENSITPEDNNILGMNENLLNEKWVSPWTGESVIRNVPQTINGETIYQPESMRTYDSIEECMNDYAAFKTGLHPSLIGETNVDAVFNEGLRGYADNSAYRLSIENIIDKYELTKYDVQDQETAQMQTATSKGSFRTDPRQYTQEQLELIWAIVAQEDSASYDGALAVISTAMNRADQNYGSHGANALSQLTADGEFCYSPSVSDPIYYQRRLGGNVPEFVKQAVTDCLEKGMRNHNYLNFRSSNRTGNYVRIGGNWFY